MPSLYHDVSSRAATALQANPTAVAGLSGFDFQADDLKVALQGLAECVRSGRWQRHQDAGATLYAMIQVAQQEYGGEDRGYWPHLAGRLRIHGGILSIAEQSQLGSWFREALDYFGYPTRVPGLTNLGPILWHAGWPRPQLRPLIGFVASQVTVYGGRAAEPDAPHALRLGEAAHGWVPPLPRTIVRLLDQNAAGIGELWARLAGAVLAGRQGLDAVRNSWEPIGGITASDILAAMPTTPQAGIAAAPCPHRPRLRYHPDTGELRLWLQDGDVSDWSVNGLQLIWQRGSAEVLPPLPPQFTLTHQPTGMQWTEVLYTDGKPTIWFGGRSGVLERGDEVAAQGLSAGCYYLVCRGTPAKLSSHTRCPLPLSYYAGGESWTAWEVDIPARSKLTGTSYFTLRVDGADWRIPLARGVTPLLRVDSEVVAQGELPDGARVALFASPPRVELRSQTTVRLVRRLDGSAEPITDWEAGAGIETVRNGGPGVYQLREVRGVGRVLLDYAVLPGLRAPIVTVEGKSARLIVPVGTGGSLIGGKSVTGGWAVERSTAEPWLTATWRWDGVGGLPITLRVPVRAVRWRLADPNGPLPESRWTHEPLMVSHRDAATKRLRLQVEVPNCDDVLLNASPLTVDLNEGPTGWGFTLPLDAFRTADSIRIRVGDQEHVAVWLSDRPVLRSFEAIIDGENLVVCWEPDERVLTTPVLGVWDPTDPCGNVTELTVSPSQIECQGGEWLLPKVTAESRPLAVGLGTRGAGFGVRPFQPAVDRNGDFVTALATPGGSPTDTWSDVAHGWTVHHRWGNGVPTSVGTGLLRLGANPPWAEILGYLSRLPIHSPLRVALTGVLLHTAGSASAEHVATATDPTAALRGWLDVGIHPFWAMIPDCRPKCEDHDYPAGYLWDLAILNNPKANVQQKRDAAERVVLEHADRELFSPLQGLPLQVANSQRSVIKMVGYARNGQMHHHCLGQVSGGTNAAEADLLLAQVCGYDAYLLVRGDKGDVFLTTTERPQIMAGRSRMAVQGVRTTSTAQYDLGWCDEGFWQLGRRQWHPNRNRSEYHQCCNLVGAITVPGWSPDLLAERLGWVEWLLQHSAGLSAPSITLPAEFDNLLYTGPLAAVHQRVLRTPPMRAEQLNSQKFTVIGGGHELRMPVYPDVPPAGKLAWRLGWLDRLSQAERATIADWSPFFAALSRALAHNRQFTHLLASCMMIAEYTRWVLTGGIGSVIRFSPTAQVARS